MGVLQNYDNSIFTRIVEEKIHSQRDREIMLLHYVDGFTADELSQKFHIEPRQVYRICEKCRKRIAEYL